MERLLIKAKSRNWRYLPVGLTLGVGIVVSTIASIFVWKWERTSIQARFDGEADKLAYTLQHNLEHYDFASSYLRGLYEASHFVEREEFGMFARRTISENPGILEIGWARRVPASMRTEYEQTIKSQGLSDFEIWEIVQGKQARAEKRPEHYPTIYIEPQNLRSLIGHDLSAQALHLDAIAKARDTKKMAIARYVRGEGNSFVIYQPVYENNLPDSNLENLRKFFKGVVYIVFQPKNVVETAIQKLQLNHLDFYLYNTSQEQLQSSLQEQSPDNVILAYDHSTKQVKEPIEQENSESLGQQQQPCPYDSEWLACLRQLQIANEEWSILILPTPVLVGNQWDSVSVLAIGLLTTTTLATYLWMSIASTVTTEKLVTSLRQVVQEMPPTEV